MPHRNIRIAVQNRQVYGENSKLGNTRRKIYFHNITIFMITQRLNMSPEALILTNSDQLEQIEQP